MCSVQLKHVSAVGRGLGPGLFGPGSVYFSCQEAGLSESAGDGGTCGQAAVDVITPALSTTADICLTRALSLSP